MSPHFLYPQNGRPVGGLPQLIIHLAQLLPYTPSHPPISPPPGWPGALHQVLSLLLPLLPHPHLAQRGGSWDAAAQCPLEWSMEDWSLGQLDLAWEPGVGRNSRNSNKPTKANPRDVVPCTSSSPSPCPSSVFFQGPPDAPLTHLPRNLGSGLSFLASPQAADAHSACFPAPTPPDDKCPVREWWLLLATSAPWRSRYGPSGCPYHLNPNKWL